MSGKAKEGCGHGHVYPNPDGSRTRCGGPGVCQLCSRDLARRVPMTSQAKGRGPNPNALPLHSRTSLDDGVTRPDYYGGPDDPFEPVKVIHEANLGPGFFIGSALKYLQRAAKKGQEANDLKKAVWYLSSAQDLDYQIPRSLGAYLEVDVARAWAPDDLVLQDIIRWVLQNRLAEAVERLRTYTQERHGT